MIGTTVSHYRIVDMLGGMGLLILDLRFPILDWRFGLGLF
jgi:hypothetical protein